MHTQRFTRVYLCDVFLRLLPGLIFFLVILLVALLLPLIMSSWFYEVLSKVPGLLMLRLSGARRGDTRLMERIVSFLSQRAVCQLSALGRIFTHICEHVYVSSLRTLNLNRVETLNSVSPWKSATESLEFIQRFYCSEGLCRMSCFEWHWDLRSGRTLVEKDERAWQTSAGTTLHKCR